MDTINRLTQKANDHGAKGNNIISNSRYNLVIGLCLLWGFFINALLVAYCTDWALSINIWVFLIGYMVSCIAGVIIYAKSDKPIISFIGYNLIVLPLGLLLAIVLYGVDSDIVFQALVTTGAVTLLMMMAATIFPNFFTKISRVLFIALIGVVIVEVLLMVVFNIHPAIFDWIIALIFCGYIGYDWVRANRSAKTIDNAIDGAASLYVNIVILFIRIVSIISRNN